MPTRRTVAYLLFLIALSSVVITFLITPDSRDVLPNGYLLSYAYAGDNPMILAPSSDTDLTGGGAIWWSVDGDIVFGENEVHHFFLIDTHKHDHHYFSNRSEFLRAIKKHE